MNDREFAEAFETCVLPPDRFHHRDHLRLALIYLREYGPVQAGVRIAESIRRYAASLGKSDKYHQTVTIAWLQLVEAAASRAPAATFDELLAANPNLLDKNEIEEYYSPELLQSDAARLDFVAPDRKPLPVVTSAGR